MNLVLEAIFQSGIVPAVRTDTAESALHAAQALQAGNIRTLELPLTVPGVLDIIRQLRRDSDILIVGAGTVLDAESARAAMLAGAQFIVSPALNIDVIRCCKRYGVPVLPGALTPTEITAAWEAGADIVKVFPASAMGGASYIRSLKAPLPHIEMMPMGGVSIDTASEYLRAGAHALGVGADLVPRKVSKEDMPNITAKAVEYANAIHTHRNKS